MSEPSDEEIDAGLISILRAEIERSPETRQRRVIEALIEARNYDRSIIGALSNLEVRTYQKALGNEISARRWRGCAIWLGVIIIWIFILKAF